MLCMNKCWFICGQSPPVAMMPIHLLLNMSHSPARQLVYLIPRVYNCSVPSSFLDDFADLAQLCEGSKFPLPSSSKNIESLLSAKGEEFVHFAKSERFVDGKESIFFHYYSHFICLSFSTSFFLSFPISHHHCVQYLLWIFWITM